MKIFIIILNYNGEKETKDCLESILKCEIAEVNLNCVVVDNDPNHRINIDVSKYKNINLSVEYNSANLGFAGGMNVGIAYSLKHEADFIVVLNNDTVVDKNFLTPLLREFQKDSSVGMVSPKIYYARGYEYHKDRYSSGEKGKVIWYGGGEVSPDTVYGKHYGVDQVDEGQFENIVETQTATGCCMMVKREVFEKVGMFDENYFLYYEDADFSNRVTRQGYKILFVPESVIWHKNAQSSGGSGSSLQDYYVTRNRLYFGFKYSPLKTRAHLIKESIVLFMQGRKWQKRGILDYWLGKMRKGNYING